MKTNRRLSPPLSSTLVGSTLLFVLAALLPAALHAQGKKKNPSSKVYVSDISGEAQIDTGDNIQDLNKRSVYTAQGTVIETKKAEKGQDKGKVFSTMVYSNGTGAYFDEDTRVEVRKFVQEHSPPTVRTWRWNRRFHKRRLTSPAARSGCARPNSSPAAA